MDIDYTCPHCGKADIMILLRKLPHFERCGHCRGIVFVGVTQAPASQQNDLADPEEPADLPVCKKCGYDHFNHECIE